MNDLTIPKNFDLLQLDRSMLTDAERKECWLSGLAQKARARLGDRWNLHKSNAPEKGTYNHVGTRVE